MIQVHIRMLCSNCVNGMVYSKAWEEWHQRYMKWQEHQPHEIYNENFPDEPEEYECPKCNGTSWIEEWTPFETFKRRLGLF